MRRSLCRSFCESLSTKHKVVLGTSCINAPSAPLELATIVEDSYVFNNVGLRPIVCRMTRSESIEEAESEEESRFAAKASKRAIKRVLENENNDSE